MTQPPVLCYHRIGGPLELGVTRVGRSVFARQMTALARAGWRTLTLEEFARRATMVGAQHAAPLHNNPPLHSNQSREFLLTFDDGYASLVDHAYPVLADLGFTATTFLITDYVGKTNTWDVRYTWKRLQHLSWSQVETWQARGFSFASHSATHRRLTWLSDRAVEAEVTTSRRLLTQRLGAAAGRAVAYPFGAVDARVAGHARAAGYELGFGGVKGAADALQLPRIPVYSWDWGEVPLGLRSDWIGHAGRLVAHLVNRCAVGTSVMNLVAPLTQKTSPPPESAADA